MEYKQFSKIQMHQYIFGSVSNEQNDQVSIIYNTIAAAHNSTSLEAKQTAKEQLNWMIPFLEKSIAFYNKEFGENVKMPDFKAYESKISNEESVLPK